MSHASTVHAEPRRVPNVILGMAAFLASETMLFLGLVSSYLVIRSRIARWPPIGQPRFPAALTAVTTLVLVASAFTMAAALRSLRGADADRGRRLLVSTLGLGALFLVVQGIEWVRLVQFGLARGTVYGGLFYTIVGAHALHLVAALVALAWTTRAVARGRIAPDRDEALTAMAMYWWFVVAVWPVLYALVYLW
jgi:heme/copper-type cytochrome/quinol oxidase subunit 3